MFLLSALIGGAITGLGYMDGVQVGDTVTLGIGVGIALVVAQLLSYLWGGYTAGRMGRGAGLANGMLVPVAAIVVALLVLGIGAALGSQARVNLPFTMTELPLENQTIVNWGLGIGIASIAAMFLGGALGGLLGARWHSKLEERAAEELPAERPRRDVSAAPAVENHDRTAEAPRVTGEGVKYEADGTTTRRVDGTEQQGHVVDESSSSASTPSQETNRDIDLTEERAASDGREDTFRR
jgi:hypothetical protein